VASKKTKRAITAAEALHVFDDTCIDRSAELLAHLSVGARDEITQYIDWYRSGRSWRGQGPRIETPPEFEKMREAAVHLADLIKRFGVENAVSIFFKAALIDKPYVLPDDQAFRDRLEQMLADLEDFADRITAAQKHGERRGRKTDRPQHFVRMVASVIERDKGQSIKRSKNKGTPVELLRDIAAVVGIGPGTVDEVLKARSQRRGEIKR
jgi:hypothetical protein